MIAIDLFSGAGGMSLGAEMAGVRIVQAVERDSVACRTFECNFPNVEMYRGDVRTFVPQKLPPSDSLVFGGPPCQGFSTSNQRTRSRSNPENWMFEEFFRVVEVAGPEWVLFENVKGLLETEGGFFLGLIVGRLNALGYRAAFSVLNACDFGVPQQRSRLFVVGNRFGKEYVFPQATGFRTTVRDAIGDLPVLNNGASVSCLPYGTDPHSDYARRMRKGLSECANNITTKSASHVIERYRHVPQGGNWQSIPSDLMKNYKDRTRCHTGIYYRLREDAPSVVLGNFRKNMLVHPTQDRGLSVREAARLQSFPDDFVFHGTIGFQQQQVGNAVPPLLAEAVFRAMRMGMRGE